MSNYECRSEGYPPEMAREIVASSPREAAEKFRARDDAESLEYYAVSDVIVAAPDGTETAWVVELAAMPSYRARPKKRPASSEPKAEAT